MGVTSQPDGSVWSLFGAILRLERERTGMGLRAIAAAVHVDYSLVGKWERGVHRPPMDAIRTIDTTLGTNGRLTNLYAAMTELVELRTSNVNPVISVSSGEMDEIRRQLLSGLVTLGAAGPAGSILTGLDNLRTFVDDRLGTSQLSEWKELAWEYALIVRDRTDIITDLSQDLLALQRLAMAAPAPEAREWESVNARMTLLLAYSLGSAGNERESRRWWASARRSAARADEPELLGAINAIEAVQALYEQRPLPLVMTRVDSALEAVQGRPSRAAASAYGAKAHVLALLGDRDGAVAALEEQARAFEQLPAEVAGDRTSLYGWPVERLLHTRSLVYTLTNHPAATAAQEEAVAAYPAGSGPAAQVRQAAQVRLHQAITAIRAGDVADGIEHAQDALTALPPGRTRYLRHLAGTVLESVPAVERSRPPAVEYRAYLQLPPGERA